MKICWISDFDATGSGYLNITVPLCAGLSRKGHDVKVIGLQYKGEEHPFEFSVIPSENMSEAMAIAQNLGEMWGFDVMIVGLDVPYQVGILGAISNRKFPYIGITPIEADPLCTSWAMALLQATKMLIISQFGTEEARRVGVDADHIQIGIDTQSWKIPTAEEKAAIRKAHGIDDDAFVILTVADNQERKNLSAAMEIVAKFSKGKKIKYIIVTREFSTVGWKLRDYAQSLGINNELMIFERGMQFSQLWSLYAISNLFLLTSKAEGLGMPILEAQAVGVPIAGTDCTGIHELLSDGRGILLPYAYKYIDPFGNEHRYFVDVKKAVKLLNDHYADPASFKTMIDNSLEYAKGRTWEISVLQIEKTLEYVTNEQKPQQEQNST